MQINLNWEMLKGLVERWAYIGVGALVAKGWLPKEISGDVILLIMFVFGTFWGARVNTQSSLVQAAASMPDVSKVVVPDAALAKSLDQGPTAKVSST